MHILVTGADGFIGSHLTEKLLQAGHTVRALAYYNAFNHWGWLESLPPHPKLEIVSGDIRDAHFCQGLVEGVQTVFHLAALIAIPYSYQAPDSYIDTNIKGTLNLCQAARASQVKCLIQTSTSEVYGTARYVPIDEQHPLQAQSPYSASKIGADALAMSFYNSFDLPVVIARPFNAYGPRQSARAVIPTLISQIASGQRVIRMGDGRPTRDFNYVEDLCSALMSLADCPQALGKTVNIATGREISMQNLAELLAELMQVEVQFETDPQRLRPQASEVFRLCGDASLLRSLIAYAPRYSLREGLQKTIAWFQQPENLQRYKPQVYNV
ncbi:MAG: SDR family NAD(P)-dependent oxidoreductase [Candidatus Sericytochromatia bacterium]|nr:SDR family NAD(P)-dependent oxidoreductase [Candidatus Sericytochromatia bacterium]